MSNPQQPEVRRSERVPALTPDASEAELSARTIPAVDSPDGPVPEAQRPGSPSGGAPDTPDLDAFAERLGVVSDEDEPSDVADVTGVHDDDPLHRRRPGLFRALVGVGLTGVVGIPVARRLIGRR